MRKIIKKYGNSAVIVFTQEELNGYNWKIGDILDLSNSAKVEVKK